MYKNPEPISGKSLMDAALRRLGLWKQVGEHKALWAFAKACGPWLAKHVRPERFARGVLYVRVAHPSWAQELTCMKPQLLIQTQQISGGDAVKDFRIRVGNIEELPDWMHEDTTDVPLPVSHSESADIPPDLDQAFYQLPDEELRSALQKLYTKAPTMP